MTASGYVDESAHEYLAMADRHFKAGNYDDGAVFLYRAVARAMELVAETRGQRCEGEDEMHALALRLDEEYEPSGWHIGGLASACAFNDNAKFHYLDYHDLLTSRSLVEELVERLVEYRKDGE